MSASATSPVMSPGYAPEQDMLVPETAGKSRSESGLQEMINQMQGSRLGSRRLPTIPSLGRILPGGGLMAGAAYSVENSTTLAMALLAGPSGSGAWCSVIGIPDFNVEAAANLGIDLDRLILIPQLEGQWLAATAAMVDVVSVILTKAPSTITGSDVARLRARLRQRGAVLITVGAWPQSEAVLSVSENRWGGLGSGAGHLQTRRLKVTVKGHNGRSRSSELSLTELRQSTWSQFPGAGSGDKGRPFIPRVVSAS
ncbi:hypothetical protein [Arthrobacter sp. TMN-50]